MLSLTVVFQMMILLTSAVAYFPLNNFTTSAKHQLTPKDLLKYKKEAAPFLSLFSIYQLTCAVTPMAALLLSLFLWHIPDFSTQPCFMIYIRVPTMCWILFWILRTQGDENMVLKVKRDEEADSL